MGGPGLHTGDISNRCPQWQKAGVDHLASSDRTAATASMSETSCGDVAPPVKAPRKPERFKSGHLEAYGSPSSSEVVSSSSPKGAGPLTSSPQEDDAGGGPCVSDSEDEGNAEDKWGALNDTMPKTTKRRIRRIVRSHSDSDLSEASTINSSSGHCSTKNTREEIRERKKERRVRQAERKSAKLEGKDIAESSFVKVENLDEDEDLVDTDQEKPISEEAERALRKQLAEARRAKRRTGSVQRKRAGKRDEILSSPTPEKFRSLSKAGRAMSFDGRSPRKVHETAGSLDVDSDIPRMIRSTSADHVQRKKTRPQFDRSNSRFNMLLDDSQNDIMLNAVPHRSSEAPRLSKVERSTEVDQFMNGLKKSAPASKKRWLKIDSDVFEANDSDEAPSMPSRREMMLGLGKGKPQSDRFLCASKCTDFAPRLSSSRRLNVLDDHEEDNRAPRMVARRKSKSKDGLDKFMAEECGKILKMKKGGGSKSVDGAQKRRKSKELGAVQ